MKAAKLLIGAALATASVCAFAQPYPTKPIRIILPVPPAAGVDIILRKAAEVLQPRLGQSMVIDNRASANMVTGTDACAKAAPDGYTICGLSALSMALNPFTIASLPYDAEKDFRPIFNMFILRGGLIAKASLPVNNAKELQAIAVSKPGVLNFGTLGPNSTVDISRQWLEQNWNTKVTAIHYKGAPLIINALVAGEIDFSWIGAYNAIGQIKSGKVKLLAIDGSKRTPVFPNVPVVGEANLTGVASARPWWGLLGPAKIPDFAVRRITDEFTKLFKEPSFEEFLDSYLVDIVAGSPEEFARFIAEDRAAAKIMVEKYRIPRE